MGEERLPGPEGDEETKPSEAEHTTVDIDRVQARDRLGFAIDWVDHRSRPQSGKVEHLGTRTD